MQLKLLEVLGQACSESAAWGFLSPYSLSLSDLSVVVYRLAGQQVIGNSTKKPRDLSFKTRHYGLTFLLIFQCAVC